MSAVSHVTKCTQMFSNMDLLDLKWQTQVIMSTSVLKRPAGGKVIGHLHRVKTTESWSPETAHMNNGRPGV